MTLGAPDLVLVLLAPLALGALIAWRIGLRFGDDGYAFLGFAWLFGALATAAVLFAGLAFGVPFGALRWAPVVAVAALLAARPWQAARAGERAAPVASAGGNALLFASVAFCLLVTGDRVVRASATLITVGDEGNIWSGKAKAILVSGGFTTELGDRLADGYVVHPDYPLLNPLLQLFCFLRAGGITHFENRLLVQAYLAAAILLLASAARRAAGGALAALSVALFTSSGLVEDVTRYAAADGLVAASLIGAVCAWARAADGERGFAAAFAFSLASLSWSKNEGLMLAVACGFAALAFALSTRRISWKALAVFAPALLLAGAQASFNARYGLTNDLVSPASGGPFWSRIVEQAPAHAPAIGRFLFDHALARPGLTQLQFALALGFVILFPRALIRRSPFASALLACSCLGFALVYLGTPREIEWHLTWSLDRILLQLLPVFTLWNAAAARFAMDLGRRARALP